ncbi:ABC transporter permease [Bacillus tuaregi]|uniref:ABC transporter permease n=1 Tax=Bacillus tuaregi TaxID=1816695 RepID=UPI0008F92DF6|nr:ABC transporter permease [Bacillus tuaregi]
MTLFNLAWKNMKGNFSHYLVYFISFVFSIVIYYTFVSLQYNENIKESILVSDTMNFMFMASSLLLILFVGIFILYSNAFFTRKRKKEVGLYSMLGLRKKTIGKMLFYENLCMGLISLVVGMVLGTFLSKLFTMILIRLMGSTTGVDFTISIEAVLQTVIVFLMITLFTSLQGYRLIYRFKLIELFHAEKKGEEKPKVSVISSMLGVVLLAVSYWMIMRPFPEELTTSYIFTNYGIALILMMAGTYLFFRSVTVYLLKLLQKNKPRYYKGTNLIEITQLFYRMKGNTNTFTLIALLSAATISFFGATYSTYYGSERQTLQDVPFSYTHLSKGDDFDTKIHSMIVEDHEHPIREQVEIPVLHMTGELSFELDYVTESMKLVPESAYNQAATALDRANQLTLSENEVVIIKPRLTEFTDSDFAGESLTLQMANEHQSLSIVGMVEGSILPFDYPDFFVVVSDELFSIVSEKMEPFIYQAYEVEDEKTTEATALKLEPYIGEDFQVSSSYYIAYKKGKEGNALNLFIFGFLGLVFLAATGSIIYFKQLTEANEMKPNYEILRKVGVSQRELRKSIRKQTLFVFGLPLIVGLLHGGTILYFISNFISSLIGANMFIPLFSAMLAFIIIYAIYYIMTVKTYTSIVNK